MTTIDLQHVMPITDRPPSVMVEGAGSWLRDAAGREYLDFVQGWAVNCLGHSPAVVVDALTAQASRLINCSPAYHNAGMASLASVIAETSGLHHVFFCNTGAEANEGAIKLARRWGQRHRGGAFEIVTMHGAFHGRTLATMSASGKPAFEPLFEPKVPGFRKVALNDLDAVAAAITDRTVAVMLEPIQGPVLIEGPAGVGKTETAVVTRCAIGADRATWRVMIATETPKGSGLRGHQIARLVAPRRAGRAPGGFGAAEHLRSELRHGITTACRGGAGR